MSDLNPMLVGRFAPRPRSRIEYGQGETTIYLRVQRSLLSIFSLVFFLVIGSFGGLFVALLMSAGTGDAAFMQVWMVIWTFALMFIFVRLLWLLFGREKLVARNAGLDIIRSILLIPWTQHFPTSDVGRLRFIANDTARSVKINGRIIPQSALGIIVDGRELKLGHGISESEAALVIEAMKQRLVPMGRRK